MAAGSRTGAAAVLYENSPTFNLAHLFLGPAHGDRVRQLYAFCRYVDDLADKCACKETGLAALNRLEADLTRGRSSIPIVASFITLASDSGIEPTLPSTLITGAKFDLGSVAFETEGEVIRYAYQVAGVVGLMMCRVLEIGDRRAEPYAIDLGIAMQLTNIARDVAEDAALGRRYLPGDWLGGASCEDLIAPEGSIRPVVCSAVGRLLHLADRYYDSGWHGLSFLPFKSRFAVALAGCLYREIGRQIAAKDYSVWHGKTTVTALGKLGCALRTLPLAVLRVDRTAQPHQTQLHSALTNVIGAGGCQRRIEDGQSD